MIQAPLPKRLRRSAIKRAFPRVRESTWDNLFDNEKNNGLVAHRVPGPDKFTYYDVEGVMVWLQERDLYRHNDFYEPGEFLFEGRTSNITKHALMAW